jgi:hypothetical protein
VKVQPIFFDGMTKLIWPRESAGKFTAAGVWPRALHTKAPRRSRIDDRKIDDVFILRLVWSLI